MEVSSLVLGLFNPQLKEHTVIRLLTDATSMVSHQKQKTQLFVANSTEQSFHKIPIQWVLPVWGRSVGHPPWGQTAICHMVFVSVTFLTLVAWAGHARGVMVNMGRWGIRWPLPSSSEPQLRNYPVAPTLEWLLLHLAAQSSRSDCRNRCFARRLTLRSNRDVHVLCPRV